MQPQALVELIGVGVNGLCAFDLLQIGDLSCSKACFTFTILNEMI